MTSSNAITYGEINAPLLTRAMQALIKHHNAQQSDKSNLLGDETNVNLEIGLFRVPGNPSPKPIRIVIPHPLHKIASEDGDNDNDGDDDDAMEAEEDYIEKADICIIVKEASKPWVQEMIEKFPNHLGNVKKVLGLDSLRKKFGRFDQKRELLAKYDLFLADDRILPMIGKAIGKKFFDKKKQPIPITLTRKEALPFAVQNCLKSTFMHIPSGRCISVRVGNTAMPIHYLVKNCETVAKEAAKRIPSKWKNILKLSIKTSDSVSLPFYNITPEELMEAKELVQEEEEPSKKEQVVNTLSKKRKETETEKKTEIADTTTKKKKKKEKDELKSPLLQALKKQKTADAETTTTTAEAKLEETKPAKKEKKSKKKRSNSDVDTNATETATKEESTKKDAAETTKKEKKRSKKEDKMDAAPAPAPPIKKGKAESKEFIAAKKFKGAKKGYVFKMGKNGLGYYVDIKPVVDKAKLAKMGSRPKGGRNKSPAARKGGRRGR